MPTYCFRSRDRRGEVIERVFPSSRIPKSVKVGRRRYDRARDAEWGGISVPSTVWANPIHCVASGVHPSQRKELETYLKEAGVPTRVDADGNPIYTSAQHRRKALKARGMHDNASYF